MLNIFFFYNLSNLYIFWFLLNMFWNIEYLLILANFIFTFGIFGIIMNYKNFLISMLFIEVMYTGIFFYFILGALLLNIPAGQIYALVVLISAACESVIGLGILIIIFKYDNSILFKNFSELRG